jgi:hypothetical protein
VAGDVVVFSRAAVSGVRTGTDTPGCSSAFLSLNPVWLPLRRWSPAEIGINLKKSRVREIRPLGSVRAKAEWLSYSTMAGGEESRES